MRPIGFNVCTPGGPTAASDGRAAAAAAAAARASRRIASNSFCTCLWRAFICRCSLPISCFAAFSSCCSRRTSALSAAALKVGKDSDINANCTKCKRRSCPPNAAHNDMVGKGTEQNPVFPFLSERGRPLAFTPKVGEHDGRHNAVASACPRSPTMRALHMRPLSANLFRVPTAPPPGPCHRWCRFLDRD